MRSKQVYVRKAIEASFLKLLDERPFEKITVKDIVEECGLTRNTFYNYYEDTYDIVDGLLQEQMRSLLHNLGQKTSPAQAMKQVAVLAFENPRVIRHLFHSPKKEELLLYFDKAIELAIGHFVDGEIGESHLDPNDRKMIIETYSFVASGFLRRWIMGGMTTSPTDAFDRLDSLFSGSMQKAIERAASEPKET